MKIIGFILLTLVTLNVQAELIWPPHLNLEMTAEEYRILLKKYKRVKNRSKSLAENQEAPVIGKVIAAGTRMLQLQNKLNASKSVQQSALVSTTRPVRVGISINTPKITSLASIEKAFADALATMPDALKNIVTGTDPLPETLPITEKDFSTAAPQMYWAYGEAARFRHLSQWMDWYIGAAKRDIRGYNYLVQNKITPEILKGISLIPGNKLSAIKTALLQLCNNSTSTYEECEKEMTATPLPDFLTRYMPVGEFVWKSFFEIPVDKKRKDITWSSDEATIPFITPDVTVLVPYVKGNVEDEFRWNGWKLTLNMGPYESGPILSFSPGAVPHVDQIGGNRIIMDQNLPVKEYESQWTIRHEFGHVLGLPDCYHEFYDVKQQAFINYELDTTDLMCSRAGNMNERIFKELKRNYEKANP